MHIWLKVIKTNKNTAKDYQQLYLIPEEIYKVIEKNVKNNELNCQFM